MRDPDFAEAHPGYEAAAFSFVMPALVAGIHVLELDEDVDGRDKPGHDVTVCGV
jgi:hypothetical protein